MDTTNTANTTNTNANTPTTGISISKADFKALLKRLADELEISRSVSGMEFGALYNAVLVEEGLIDPENFPDAMKLWEQMPKNNSACRQYLFEQTDSGEKLSKAQLMAQRYMNRKRG